MNQSSASALPLAWPSAWPSLKCFSAKSLWYSQLGIFDKASSLRRAASLTARAPHSEESYHRDSLPETCKRI
jgi:hypothetical protein